MKKLSFFLLFLLLCSFWGIIGNNRTVLAEPSTIVVPDDYVSIQEAIDNALNGDTIFVKNGVYSEPVEIHKPLTIYS